MRKILKNFSEGFDLLSQSIGPFLEKLCCFGFFYGRFFIFPALFFLGVGFLLDKVGVSDDISYKVFKFGSIFGQIIPAVYLSPTIKEFPDSEFSVDFYLAGWTITMILLWFFFKSF